MGTGDHGLRGHFVIPCVVMAQVVEQENVKTPYLRLMEHIVLHTQR